MSLLGIVQDVNVSTPKLENQGGLEMNYNRNKKLKQITPETLVVGIDIAKEKHVARVVDDRDYEFGKRLIFENNITGFEQLLAWVSENQEAYKKHMSSSVANRPDTTGSILRITREPRKSRSSS